MKEKEKQTWRVKLRGHISLQNVYMEIHQRKETICQIG